MRTDKAVKFIFCVLMGLLVFSFYFSSQADTLPRNIEPLGFGRDSYFAYKFIDFNCQCDGAKCSYAGDSGICERETIEIVDLRTDWKQRFSKLETKEFQKKGIKMQTDLPFKTFPLETKDDVYEILLSEECNRDYEKFPTKEDGKNLQQKCVIEIQSKKRGIKKVASLPFTPSPGNAFEVTGYFKSPFEERIAIVVEQKSKLFEEQLRVNTYVLGSGLRSHFKKQ